MVVQMTSSRAVGCVRFLIKLFFCGMSMSIPFCAHKLRLRKSNHNLSVNWFILIDVTL